MLEEAATRALQHGHQRNTLGRIEWHIDYTNLSMATPHVLKAMNELMDGRYGGHQFRGYHSRKVDMLRDCTVVTLVPVCRSDLRLLGHVTMIATDLLPEAVDVRVILPGQEEHNG